MITCQQENITGKDGLKTKRPGRKLFKLHNENNFKSLSTLCGSNDHLGT